MKWIAKLWGILLPVWAEAQITIDGVMNEPEWQIIGLANGNSGFGPDNRLGVLKYYSNGTTLYIGITGTVDFNATVNNIVLFLDNENYIGRGSAQLGANMNGGIGAVINNTVFRSGSASCNNPPNPNGLSASIMDNDFDADYAFAFNKGIVAGTFYMDAVKFSNQANDGSLPSYNAGPLFVASTDLAGTPVSASINIPNWNTGASQISFAYLDGYDAITEPNRGVEIAFPYATLPAYTTGERVRFFVLITNNEGFASNVCIPGDPGSSNLGCGFNLSTISNPGNDIFYTQPWVTLPLSFLQVRAQLQNKQALLEWSVVQDVEARDYVVERSADGQNFRPLATLPARRERDIARYQFTDPGPLPGRSFYRIRATGNGLSKLSPQVSLLYEPDRPGAWIFPNPARGQLQWRLADWPAGLLTATLVNTNGQTVYLQTLTHDGRGGTQAIPLPMELGAGMYWLRLSQGPKTATQSVFIHK